jgi:redox-sensitive bicupin YhaK (pirin superfamily)
MPVEIRRGTARFTEREIGRATRHAFSFGAVYDPEHVGFGPMICHDEHVLGEGRGFDTHRHADLDIVTWVVSGALTHTDSIGGPTGDARTLLPGQVGHLHAGSGVDHSEVAAAPQTKFVQVWLRSYDDPRPAYSVHPVAPGPLTEALTIGGSTLCVARLAGGESVTLPEADLLHVYVASGAMLRHSLAAPLTAGDAMLVSRAPEAFTVRAAIDSELLIWRLSAPDQTS